MITESDHLFLLVTPFIFHCFVSRSVEHRGMRFGLVRREPNRKSKGEGCGDGLGESDKWFGQQRQTEEGAFPEKSGYGVKSIGHRC